mmetsp:Transcript_16662/g.36157  ORF Transcript_16662/g.36157 Transcript_16662/m.36157 type:complete len:83 (+) Transcript_16662:309-557(+)
MRRTVQPLAMTVALGMMLATNFTEQWLMRVVMDTKPVLMLEPTLAPGVVITNSLAGAVKAALVVAVATSIMHAVPLKESFMT